MTRPWPRLAELSARQHGVVHRRQAEALRVPGRTLSAWVGQAGWQRPQRGVYAPPGGSDTFERRVAAARLAAGPRVLAARSTSARLWRLTDSRLPDVELVVPVGRGVPRLTGVTVTRSWTLLLAGCRRLLIPRDTGAAAVTTPVPTGWPWPAGRCCGSATSG